MSVEKITIRQAKLEDVEGIAYVGYHSWLTTYTGIFPDKYISQRTPEKRIPHIKQNWVGFEENLADYPTRKILVAETIKEEIVGFVVGGEIFYKELPYDCEMYAFYILKEYQQKGLGTKLFRQMLEFLKTFEYSSMIIWVLKENPSCKFYEKMGGKAKEVRLDERDGNGYEVVGYVWDDIYKI